MRSYSSFHVAPKTSMHALCGADTQTMTAAEVIVDAQGTVCFRSKGQLDACPDCHPAFITSLAAAAAGTCDVDLFERGS